ncbi:MAG TPA: hypothetical protein PKV27_08535 [Ilumatobacteraceae bacterium]|nr:hypothetical protein [Ilumatobacteraceae bacterium]
MSKWKLATTATIATVGVVLAGGALAFAQENGPGLPGDQRGMGRGMHRFGRDHDGPMWIRLLVLGLLAAAVVGLIIWLVTRGRRPAIAGAATATAPVSPTANAEAILAERLARSEISADDYRSMRAALRDTETIAAPQN